MATDATTPASPTPPAPTHPGRYRVVTATTLLAAGFTLVTGIWALLSPSGHHLPPERHPRSPPR